MTPSKPGRVWSEVFRRSRISPHVFVVAEAAAGQVDQVVAGLGLPRATSNSLFDNAHWATPLLDGAVARLLTYGLPALPSGTRVYGHRPLRLLCYLMDLRPPARALTGERNVPDIDQLLADLDWQRQAEPQALLAQARTAMANDAQEVLTAVRVFFGEEATGVTAVEMPG
ncbi:hypothetical protein FXF50_05020 [Micromonospora sp. AP08]|uniref:hypothetical protein n=1 Tax=Micromonospora sp. AP08 TaxID=2604467 RepID=UPI0011D6093C|nr:hypothetical protein [Micromonospora sp. AP08]TYB39741.1 hypothetical protein FXF50_05020 [Micromonospora sp. AP08]